MKYFSLFITFLTLNLNAQEIDSTKIENSILDSLYISEVQDKKAKDKVLHAEPLYIDLIRDLGARKGEKEWNIGTGLTDKMRFDEYTALVEYEWAPIDRLGLEIELPFTFYYNRRNSQSAPKSKLNSLKLAGQYSFYVSEKNTTTLALGYIQEIEFVEFAMYSKNNFIDGYVYNPFFIGAKRWGNNLHTLVYTGPVFHQSRFSQTISSSFQLNSNFHYMIPGTRNFIGIECNQIFQSGAVNTVLRPQMRVSIADNLIVGIVTGIPVNNREDERISSFLRLIYEPGHKIGKHTFK